MTACEAHVWRRQWKLTGGEIFARALASLIGRSWCDVPHDAPSARRSITSSPALPAQICRKKPTTRLSTTWIIACSAAALSVLRPATVKSSANACATSSNSFDMRRSPMDRRPNIIVAKQPSGGQGKSGDKSRQTQSPPSVRRATQCKRDAGMPLKEA
jgi:hypothetical protein